jgi:hypothetical protein
LKKSIGNTFIEFWCRIAPDRRCNLDDKEQSIPMLSQYL